MRRGQPPHVAALLRGWRVTLGLTRGTSGLLGLILCLIVSGNAGLAASMPTQQPPPPFPVDPAPELLATYEQSQADPALTEEDRLKAAVETYFRLIYESYRQAKSLDLGIVVDKTCPSGQVVHDYNVGRIQYVLLCRSHTQSGLADYEFELEWGEVAVEQTIACGTVSVVGWAQYLQSDNRVPFREDHLVELVRTDRGWMLTADEFTNDEALTIYPVGTDFAALAESFAARVEKWEEEDAGDDSDSNAGGRTDPGDTPIASGESTDKQWRVVFLWLGGVAVLTILVWVVLGRRGRAFHRS